MTNHRVDVPYKRNSKCPCNSGKKVKQCCSHLLNPITTKDLEYDEHSRNADANSYVRTSTTLQNLDCPNEDSRYRAKMTCGCCHGRGDRPERKSVLGRPTPERRTCESCDGLGVVLG